MQATNYSKNSPGGRTDKSHLKVTNNRVRLTWLCWLCGSTKNLTFVHGLGGRVAICARCRPAGGKP